MDPVPTAALPADLQATPVVRPPRLVVALGAILQIVAVCGIPTQVALLLGLSAAGLEPFVDGVPSLPFFALLGFLDTAAVCLLVQIFLSAGGEAPEAVLFGTRPVGRDLVRGLLWTPLVFIAVLSIVVVLRLAAPMLHNVEVSPFDAFLRTPTDALVFLAVVVLAGGVREEVQRAFILHRFDQHLGGVYVGVAIFSLFFGAMHLDQGVDVALAIGILGLFWGLSYARRRSAAFAIANHAGFNALQVGQAMLARALGVG